MENGVRSWRAVRISLRLIVGFLLGSKPVRQLACSVYLLPHLPLWAGSVCYLDSLVTRCQCCFREAPPQLSKGLHVRMFVCGQVWNVEASHKKEGAEGAARENKSKWQTIRAKKWHHAWSGDVKNAVAVVLVLCMHIKVTCRACFTQAPGPLEILAQQPSGRRLCTFRWGLKLGQRLVPAESGEVFVISQIECHWLMVIRTFWKILVLLLRRTHLFREIMGFFFFCLHSFCSIYFLQQVWCWPCF